MKKIIVLSLVLVLILSNLSLVSAANYLPSVDYEAYPGIVVIEDENGKKVIGYVENADGEVLSTEYHGCILVTPVMDAKRKISYLSDEAEQLLVDTYEALAADNAKLSELIPQLNDVAKDALGENATADDLVILELVDITAVCEDLIQLMEVEGNTITLTFKMVVPNEAFVTVMTLKDGEWEFADEVVNNDDGTVSVKFNRFCPVLFLTGFPVEDVAPVQNNMIWIIVLCGVILILGVTVFFLLRRKNK